MDGIISDLMDYGAQLHAQHDHPDTALAFARRMGVHVIPGNLHSANGGPPALITYTAALGTHRHRFGLWHEVAHVVMPCHGIDRHYESELGCVRKLPSRGKNDVWYDATN
ncbi:hypothetical protein E7T09_08500 [Deinococcus sp. KSM4-11]|uniref:hypothetical protein n=1 Tax=Deinococcus sp. KSM4-11 TaxID=2568654 RepID=UPI0010A4DBBD|nr:hypothetical protein [Deinococcus sp. KSM4-11]THF87186.1 hypothetical protein E7T09_08500 [Deinococcus sp. KSM4-11]